MTLVDTNNALQERGVEMSEAMARLFSTANSANEVIALRDRLLDIANDAAHAARANIRRTRE